MKKNGKYFFGDLITELTLLPRILVLIIQTVTQDWLTIKKKGHFIDMFDNIILPIATGVVLTMSYLKAIVLFD